MSNSIRDSPGDRLGFPSCCHFTLRLGERSVSFKHEEIWRAARAFKRDKNVFTRTESHLGSVDYDCTSCKLTMGDFKNNSRSVNRRDLWSRDRTPPQRARDKREIPSAHALSSSTDSSVKMALTCKVQYLDDTDPFASTNFPEPTRPPTYTFHLNIPLFQQIAGLHRLLNAPHNVSLMLFIPLLSFQLKFCFVVTSVCLNFFHWRA